MTGSFRVPTGYFTKRLAEDALRRTLDEARRGTLPGMARTGATFADAAAEYLRYIEQDRGRKPSTLGGYRSAIKRLSDQSERNVRRSGSSPRIARTSGKSLTSCWTIDRAFCSLP